MSGAGAGSGAYTAADVAGLRVEHSLDAIKDGEQVVLTLKDTSILDDKGEGLNEDDDVLQNVNLVDTERADMFNERRTKGRKARYTAYDDDDYYDGANPASGGFALPLPGTFVPGRGTNDAHGGGNDDDDNAAPVSFRKKRFVQGQETAEVDDATALAALDKKASKKRRRRLRKEKATKAELIRAVERARKAAEAADKEEEAGGGAGAAAGAGAGVPSGKRRKKPTDGVDEALLDDDADLQASLARARNLAKERARKATASSDKGDDDAGAVAVSELAAAAAAAEPSGDDGAATGGGGLVFTSAGNFLQQLQARVNEQRTAASAAAAAAPVAAPAAGAGAGAAAGGGGGGGGGGGDDDDDDDDDDGLEEGQEDLDVEEGEVGSGDEDSDGDGHGGSAANLPAATSMAAALNLLKQKGDLLAPEQYVGRAKDKRPDWDRPGADPAPNIKLEYRDSVTGLKLTPKEAYRQQCWTFHGHGPGQNKKQRRAEQLADRLGLGKKKGSVLTTLLKTQAQRGQAHVVLSQKQQAK